MSMPEDSSTIAASKPRAIALVGPTGSGKSTLFDGLMAAAGVTSRRPGSAQSRALTTELRLGHCSFMGDRWSILDCPGSIEFSYETASALAAVDLAVVVCEPAPERAPTLAPLMKLLEDRAIPHLIFINKIDTLSGRVRDTLQAIQAYSKRPLLLRQVPIRDGETVTGYVDLVHERAYRYRAGQPSELVEIPADMLERKQEARAGLLEILADHDDLILEKVLEDIPPSLTEIYPQLHKDQASGAIVEVLLGAAQRDNGIQRLWKALRHDVPGPLETATRRGIPAGDQPLAQIFKTQYRPHAGKLSYARVWRGALKEGAVLNGVRVGGIHLVSDGELLKVPEADLGELVVLGRLEGLPTGTILGDAAGAEGLEFPEPPPPVYSLTIAAPDRKDDAKLSSALHKLVEEDPSLSVVQNAEAGETVLHGQGEAHLNLAISRMSQSGDLQVVTGQPAIPFRETIRRSVFQHSRLKRQTGGHGQFADVKLEVQPRGSGEGFQFVDRIVGGAVPKQYIPAVREAAEEAMQKGPLGHPVVDVTVVLTDGGFHSVDSSDMAFRTATRNGIAEALAKAEPVLLEPIHHVTVKVPNTFTPSAQRLLSGRRGQILGYAECPDMPGWDEVEALTPAAELRDFILELRSQTLGLGSYRHYYDHLAEVRGRTTSMGAQKVPASRR
jgi:elongation factor G